MALLPLIAGNWKMNGARAQGLIELKAMREGATKLKGKAELLICPPAHLLFSFKGKGIALGAQDCHEKETGAYTGNISATMLKEAGAKFIIVGHSERRQYHDESDALVQAKAIAAHQAGLTAIICVGETLDQRKKGETLHVIAAQLALSVPEGATAKNTIIAYEPVWAIGSGLTPSTQDVAEVHALMRKDLSKRFKAQGEKMRLLYGGSVKPSNAKELMHVPDVNGALVGGASLKASDFLGIAEAYL